MADGDPIIEFIPTASSEKMTLIVKGAQYDRWKTARVTLTVDAPFQEFQFSASEPLDIKADWDNWNINVGDECMVLVGGAIIVRGYIDMRETFYDAYQHGVMFYGRCYNSNAYESSVRMQGSEVQLINVTFSEIMARALEGSGTNIEAPGDDGRIFPNFSIPFGDTPWNVADRTKRFIPGLRVTADPRTRTWIAHTVQLNGAGPAFIEGQNILSLRSMVDARERMELTHVRGQPPNRDDRAPVDSNDVEAYTQDDSLPETQTPRYKTISAEEPVDKQLAQGRSDHDQIQRVTDIIHCTVRVYSWFEAPGVPFWYKRRYIVHSPMAKFNMMPLWSRVVMFEQSEAGSTTTLELSSFNALYKYWRPGPNDPTNLGPRDNIGGQGVPQSNFR